MGIDYVQLDPISQPVFPLAIGLDDDGWPVGDGGGINASFVQENGTINDLPGNPNNPEIARQSDNDYYFAGVYTKTIAENDWVDYEPVGIVPRNEESAERAFASEDNDLRYHFNLPSTLEPSDEVTVSFDPLNLDESGTDPRYGIEIYFNEVLVQEEIVIQPDDLGNKFTTPPFTLASVNAETGPGPDNIVSLKGVNYSWEGGGNWMGIDYVQISSLEDIPPELPPEFLSSVVNNGQLTLSWTGSGNLEWASEVTGPWTAVTPIPKTPYSENLNVADRRFYRLRRP